MKRNKPIAPISQEPDRNSLTFSIPRALIPIPILSPTDQMIISRITSLSSKYSDSGGCNLSNRALAYRQECSVSTVSSAISKATWLGMLQSRKDELDKHPNKDGSISVTQRRRIRLAIPEIWVYYGERWADFYFKGDEQAKKEIDWMREYVSKKYKNRKRSRTEKEKLNLIKMIKKAYEFFSRGYLENPKAPFINSEGSLLEDSMLYMFTEVNVYGIKCLRSSSSLEEEDYQNSIDNIPPNTDGGNDIEPDTNCSNKYITPSLFDEFWKRYPRKEGSKGKAKSIWDRICRRKTNRPTWKEIKLAIKNQKRSDQWKNPKYIPLPTTWLNQQRWLDDPEMMKDYSTSFDSGKRSNPPINTCGSRAYQDDVDVSEFKYQKGEVVDVTEIIRMRK